MNSWGADIAPLGWAGCSVCLTHPHMCPCDTFFFNGCDYFAFNKMSQKNLTTTWGRVGGCLARHVAQDCKPGTGKAKTEELWVWGQLKLRSETLSKTETFLFKGSGRGCGKELSRQGSGKGRIHEQSQLHTSTRMSLWNPLLWTTNIY